MHVELTSAKKTLKKKTCCKSNYTTKREHKNQGKTSQKGTIENNPFLDKAQTTYV